MKPKPSKVRPVKDLGILCSRPAAAPVQQRTESELTGLGRRYGTPGVSQQVRAGSGLGRNWERGTGIGVSGIRGVAGWRNSW